VVLCFRVGFREIPLHDGLGLPRTTDLRLWLWVASIRGGSKPSPRSNFSGRATHGFLVANLERGSSPDSPSGLSVVRGLQTGVRTQKTVMVEGLVY